VSVARSLQQSIEIELQDGLSRLQSGLNQSIKPAEIIVFTKSDNWNTDIKNCVQAAATARQKQGLVCVTTSSHTEQNMGLTDALIEMSVRLLNRGSAGHVPILISKRQQDKTNLAIESLTEALTLIQNDDYPEKIASLLIATTQHLSDVIGEVGNEDILTNIFSNFCIGK
jgi:tRNA U34 5-carboxymethylaminomethyl modifying GTPase MnmE/TrmE